MTELKDINWIIDSGAMTQLREASTNIAELDQHID
jgi:hypothetical protein